MYSRSWEAVTSKVFQWSKEFSLLAVFVFCFTEVCRLQICFLLFIFVETFFFYGFSVDWMTCFFEQVLPASVGMVGETESVEGSQFVDALSVKIFQFWTWLLWRRVKMIFLGWLTLRSQEWGAPREHQKSGSCSTSLRRMMFGSMLILIAEPLQPNLVSTKYLFGCQGKEFLLVISQNMPL